MFSFDFSEKVFAIAFPPDFVYNFLRKIFFIIFFNFEIFPMILMLTYFPSEIVLVLPKATYANFNCFLVALFLFQVE